MTFLAIALLVVLLFRSTYNMYPVVYYNQLCGLLHWKILDRIHKVVIIVYIHAVLICPLIKTLVAA